MSDDTKSKYFDLLKLHPRLISIGVYHTFASSFGQTIIIALFVQSICQKFDLTPGQYGAIYGGVTVASAFTLTFTGPVVDRVHLRWYSLVTGLVLSAGALTMAISQNIYVLVAGLFLVRHGGQALMPHCTSTTMARYFHGNRGKALALSNLGYAVGEGVLPTTIGLLIVAVGWQSVYGIISAFVLLAGGFVCFLLIRQDDDFADPRTLVGEKEKGSSVRPLEVIKQPKFYLLLPCYLMAPFLLTGFLFYQSALAIDRGWSLTFAATSLSFFAIFRFLFSFVSGALIDRFSASKVIIFHLFPFMLGLLTLLSSKDSFTAIVFWAFCGATVGLGSNIKQAIWAELYGTAYLGAVKSVIAPFTVVSTAFSPFIFGKLIDGHFEMNNIIQLSIGLIVLSMILCFFSMKGGVTSES